jgi:Flp pilus assembly protein TadB
VVSWYFSQNSMAQRINWTETCAGVSVTRTRRAANETSATQNRHRKRNLFGCVGVSCFCSLLLFHFVVVPLFLQFILIFLVHVHVLQQSRDRRLDTIGQRRPAAHCRGLSHGD